MKKLDYKVKVQFRILYIILFISIVTNIIFNNNMILKDKTQIIKNMDETIEVSNLNNTINTLQASHTEYATKIQTHKTNLATAITNAGVSTSSDATFETMITNVSNILSNKTSDATATAAQILTGKTAYVKGSKVTGIMKDNKAVAPTALNAGESYTIPEGYHNGSGKVTANTLASQTQATATADNITAGKTAWVNGNLITGTNTIGAGDGNFQIIKTINTSASFNQGTTVNFGDLSKYRLAIVIASRTMTNSAYSYAVRYSSCKGATANGNTYVDYAGNGTTTLAVLLSDLSSSVSVTFSGVGTGPMYYGIIGIV